MNEWLQGSVYFGFFLSLAAYWAGIDVYKRQELYTGHQPGGRADGGCGWYF